MCAIVFVTIRNLFFCISITECPWAKWERLYKTDSVRLLSERTAVVQCGPPHSLRWKETAEQTTDTGPALHSAVCVFSNMQNREFQNRDFQILQECHIDNTDQLQKSGDSWLTVSHVVTWSCLVLWHHVEWKGLRVANCSSGFRTSEEWISPQRTTIQGQRSLSDSNYLLASTLVCHVCCNHSHFAISLSRRETSLMD